MSTKDEQIEYIREHGPCQYTEEAEFDCLIADAIRDNWDHLPEGVIYSMYCTVFSQMKAESKR